MQDTCKTVIPLFPGTAPKIPFIAPPTLSLSHLRSADAPQQLQVLRDLGHTGSDLTAWYEALAIATSSAANTIARALLSGIGSKGAGDSLQITWTHTILGA